MSARNDVGPATIIFMVVMGGAVAVAIASDIAEPLCRAEEIRKIAPDKIYFGCLEFWIQRYKEVISAVIAAIVAFIVVQPVYRQLRETQRQTSAAAQNVIHGLIIQVDEELSLLDRIEIQSRSLGYVVDNPNPTVLSGLSDGEREFGMLAITFDNTLAMIARIGERRNDGEVNQSRRVEFLAECGIEVRNFEAGLGHWVSAGRGALKAPTVPELQISRDANQAIVEICQGYRAWLLETRSRLLERYTILQETFVAQ